MRAKPSFAFDQGEVILSWMHHAFLVRAIAQDMSSDPLQCLVA